MLHEITLVGPALLVDFICVETCLSTVTIVANGCGPVASPMTGKRLGSPPCEQQPRTLHHRANVGPCIIKC
jgi:hypothetical protein